MLTSIFPNNRFSSLKMQRVQIATLNASQTALLGREKRFVADCWAVDVRPDRRQFHQLREASFEFPFDGACQVKLGQTTVLTVVTGELVEPLQYQPRNGIVEFQVKSTVTDGGSGTSGQLHHSRTPECAAITRMLEALIKAGRVLDADGLCAVPGIKVWSLRCSSTILNDEGNAMDATVWSVLGALHIFRRPEISIRGDTVTLHHERDPIPLSLHHYPFSVTCALVDEEGAGVFVLDPSQAEVQASPGLLTVVVNTELQVCAVHKWEGAAITYSTISKCVGAAKALAPQLGKLMMDSATKFIAERKEAAKSQFLWAQQRTGVGLTQKLSDEELPSKKTRTE